MLRSIVQYIRARLLNRRKNKAYAKLLDDINREHSSWIRFDARVDENTILEDHVRLDGGNFRNTKIGRNSYVGASSSFPNCKIGRFCSIGYYTGVIPSRHPTSFVSSWPGFFNTVIPDNCIQHYNDSISFEEFPSLSDGTVVEIGNDVWIGENVKIMPKIKIGDGAIIGANALVTKDVPPYAIVGGVPARIIRFRFSPSEIDFLMSIQWWNWDDERLKRFSAYFDSVSRLMEALELEANTTDGER